MYYLKTKDFKRSAISWGRDDDDPMYFRMFKHIKHNNITRFGIVIDITLWGRRLLLEF